MGVGSDIAPFVDISMPKKAFAYRVDTFLGSWRDDGRGRELPYKLYWPVGYGEEAVSGAFPLILFSHGLGGSREGGECWLRHWAARGFAGLALQHPGSDSHLFVGQSRLALRRMLQSALTFEQLEARATDVRFVLDTLRTLQRSDVTPWHQLDLARVGYAGHSFGAVTVLAAAGECLPLARHSLREPRIRAFLALSPSARGDAADYAGRFAGINAPFFSITGSRDDGIGLSDITPENRRIPYQYMNGAGQYLLVLDGAGHLVFSGHGSTLEQRWHRQNSPLAENLSGRSQRMPEERYVSVVQQASLAFWQAHLSASSEEARQGRDWLEGHAPPCLRTLLAAEDIFFVRSM